MKRIAVIFTAVVLLLALSSCDNVNKGNAHNDTSSSKHSTTDGMTNVISAPPPEDDAELAQAIALARATAEAARTQWSRSSARERERWWIKWEAPTAENNVEHVWVQPLNWSPFRIEGVLISSPIAELAGGKREGDIVSFPIEELSDWIHLREGSSLDDFNKLYEGGFTIKVLEGRGNETTNKQE